MPDISPSSLPKQMLTPFGPQEGLQPQDTHSAMSSDLLHAAVPSDCCGWRLDRTLVLLFPDYSRACLQRWIRGGFVTVDDAPAHLPRQSVRDGARIAIYPPALPEHSHKAEAIDLNIVHEDEAIIVLNKPAGLVMHPGAGRPAHTLYNALLHHDPKLAALPRAGLVHRLDKDTTGLVVVARSEQSYNSLLRQMRQRHIQRDYMAVVDGCLRHGGTADFSIGRDPRHRVRMAVTNLGRHARTSYRVVERFTAHTLISARLETGRTHQIRVHAAHMGYPVTGDSVYGRRRILHQSSPELAAILKDWRRQALHACELSFSHPLTAEDVRWHQPPPADMQQLLAALRSDATERSD